MTVKEAKKDKGVNAPIQLTQDELWISYKGLWDTWAEENPGMMKSLAEKSKGRILMDRYAGKGAEIRQDRALAEILNEKYYTAKEPTGTRTWTEDFVNEDTGEIYSIERTGEIRTEQEQELVELKAELTEVYRRLEPENEGNNPDLIRYSEILEEKWWGLRREIRTDNDKEILEELKGYLIQAEALRRLGDPMNEGKIKK